MIVRYVLLYFLLSGFSVGRAAESAKPKPDRAEVYKTVGDVALSVHIFEPVGHRTNDRTPAIVFFFGGGWINGTADQFYPLCAELAKLGLVAISADYRTASKNQTTPRECVMDARSCLRWVRSHAAQLGINPEKIAAGGGSAGGHIAAATAMLKGLDEPGDDLSISCRPEALVLFNPVLDNGPGGYGYERVEKYYREFSPQDNIRPGLPPMLLQYGTEDKLNPLPRVKAFQAEMEKNGNRCELKLYEGQGHGFFNFNDGKTPYYAQTRDVAISFLRANGYLPAPAAAPVTRF